MSLNTADPQVVKTEYKAMLGEGPVWDDHEQQLYWVDILNGMLMIHDPERNENYRYDIGEHIGAAALRKKGGLVLALKSGFAFFNIGEQKVNPIADPEAGLNGNRFNDGKCDPAGRFWAGTMAYNLQQGAGSLYSLDPDQDVEVKITGVTISNGMAWNTDDNIFYFIDTPERTVYAFDYEEERGDISNRRIIKEFSRADGFPDGMTIDTGNKLWIALYNGRKVIRIDPVSGKTLFEIPLPVPKVTSCTFGGADFDELYITTARENMSKDEIKEAPMSGSLFKAKIPFKGKPAFRFAG